MHGHGHINVVHGDSAFASVATCTALLEHSTGILSACTTSRVSQSKSVYNCAAVLQCIPTVWGPD